ncbi:nucleotide disphospho-sugar-binding domain-containing protein [Nocardiopsis sp. NPDC049922]|uniref:glycosyltransferase n=1 Tax=Nocardiopsis sp. NPDC049922 TaxID=3155157 RepID=UPI00340ECCB2
MARGPRSGERVLWVPYAQYGSLYPVVPLIQAVLRDGHEVVMLGPSELTDLAETLGCELRPYWSDITYDWARRASVDKHGLGPDVLGSGWFIERVKAEYEEVGEAIASCAPTTLLIDSFVTGAGMAAESHAVPWASYVHYLIDQDADVDAMHRVWWEGTERDREAYLHWWGQLREDVGVGPEHRPVADAPWYRLSPHLTFVLGHPWLRRGRKPTPSSIVRTSFPPWDTLEPEEPVGGGTARTLERPRVLVSNSSAWQDDLSLVESALSALRDANVDVVVTVSAEHPRITDVPSNAVLLPHTPHTRLLPSVDIVVSTAGLGLVSKALWWGIPLVLVPRGRDQGFVADAVVSAGCGLRLSWPPDPRELAEAVKSVMASEALRKQAREFSGRVAGYPRPEEAAALLFSQERRV